MILTSNYVNFLIKHNLTQEQYLLLHLLYYREFNLMSKYKKAFPLKEGSMIPKLQIKDLVTREFLVQTTNKGYKLGKAFIEIFVTPEVAVDEIYNLYPAFIKSSLNVDIPLTSMDKNVFKNIYISKIFGNVDEHKEVLKDIQYGIDNNLIKIGINKFLTSDQWKSFRKRRLTETTTKPPLINDNF